MWRCQMKEGVRLLTDGGKFNLISSDGVEEAVRVLKRFQQAALSRGASLRAVATSAVREARNGDHLLRHFN
jgi:exopolyphosphatase/pppGpp-phosphohydrolase